MIISLFLDLNEKIHKSMKFDDWYVWVHMDKSAVTLPIFQSLDAYWPGLQVGTICFKGLCKMCLVL